MKNYIVSDYENLKDIYADLTAELNELIKTPVEVEHIKYGKGVLMNLRASTAQTLQGGEFAIFADIEFYFNDSLRLAINKAMDRHVLIVPEPEKSILNDFAAAGADLQLEIDKVSRQRATAEYEAEKQAKELAKQEVKLNARIEKGIQDFTDMANESRSQCATGEFYYALGWLAKNVGTISAAMPDYILPYFEKQFGTDYTPSVVDSKQLTPAGNPSKYTLSMQASIPKKAQDSIPAVFFDYLNPNRTAITKTSFVWELIEIYGFQFGKTQDVDKIRGSIPTHCLEQFENGYAE